jgi:hypothetical protein
MSTKRKFHGIKKSSRFNLTFFLFSFLIISLKRDALVQSALGNCSVGAGYGYASCLLVSSKCICFSLFPLLPLTLCTVNCVGMRAKFVSLSPGTAVEFFNHE